MGNFLRGFFALQCFIVLGVGAYYGAHDLGYAWYDPDTYDQMIALSLTVLGGSVVGIFATIQVPVWFNQARSSAAEQSRRRKQAKFEAEEAAQKEAAISEAIKSSEETKLASLQQSQFQKLSLSIGSLHEASIELLEGDSDAHKRELANMNDILSDIIREDQLSALNSATNDQFEDIGFHVKDVWQNLGEDYQSGSFGKRFDLILRSKVRSHNDK